MLDAPGALSVEAAREAHRRAEVRRHLRFLEAQEPGRLLRLTAIATAQERVDSGAVSLSTLREVGRLLFEHEYTFTEGLGSADSQQALRAGRSPFRRVHRAAFGGPETNTCTSCHWRGGGVGSGALQDNSLVHGDGEHVSSADPRNPPSLLGVGVVEALAAEMSAELQAIRSDLVERAKRRRRPFAAPLVAKGVDFGLLRVRADGSLDTTAVDGVDPDLVIKPFGWKGTVATLHDFVEESLQIHFGVQSEELVLRHRRTPSADLVGSSRNPVDPDGDGKVCELTSGQHTALVAFLATRALPVVRPPATLHDFAPAADNLPAPTATVFLDDWTRGRRVFVELGCSTCHIPRLVLESPLFRTRSRKTGGVLEIDLAREGEHPRLQYDARLGGYPVWLFSDLKRHDMGARNTSRHLDHGVAREQYLTRRLWGLASSPPYFYNGESAWIDDAIFAHGGDASDSVGRFRAAPQDDRGALLVYLLSLSQGRELVVPR